MTVREWFSEEKGEFTRQMRGVCAKALRCDVTPNVRKTASSEPHQGIRLLHHAKVQALGNPKNGAEGKNINWHYSLFF